MSDAIRGFGVGVERGTVPRPRKPDGFHLDGLIQLLGPRAGRELDLPGSWLTAELEAIGNTVGGFCARWAAPDANVS